MREFDWQLLSIEGKTFASSFDRVKLERYAGKDCICVGGALINVHLEKLQSQLYEFSRADKSMLAFPQAELLSSALIELFDIPNTEEAMDHIDHVANQVIEINDQGEQFWTAIDYLKREMQAFEYTGDYVAT